MRIAFVDTYYPQVFNAIPMVSRTYDDCLREVLDFHFGTADFWSQAFRRIGWEAIDIVGNCDRLQHLWESENSMISAMDRMTNREIAENQIMEFHPDILFLQDVSFFESDALDRFRQHGIFLAAHISCPMPPDDRVRRLDRVFTSFPHYVSEFESRGVKATRIKLAFSPSAIEGPDGIPREQDIAVSFVGGVGDGSAPGRGWWRAGTDALERLAAEVPDFKWWGYGINNLYEDSPLHDHHHGEAWGRDYYDLLLRSRVVVNRHGEVARGCGNNMRCHEVAGCGALLITDSTDTYEHGKECLVYPDAAGLIKAVRWAMDHPDDAHKIADAGHRKCISENTYDDRAKKIARVLESDLDLMRNGRRSPK